MKNNKGFSLIELIIVIALMGIILGFASVGLGALSSQNEKAASKDIYNMIGSAKTVAMSRAECYLVLTSDSIRIVYRSTDNTYVTASENSIKKTVLVSYSEDGTSYSQIDGSTTEPGIVIKFDRSTGGFESFYYYDTSYTSGGAASPCSSSMSPISNIKSIKVGDGDKAIYITLVKSTGKYSMD